MARRTLIALAGILMLLATTAAQCAPPVVVNTTLTVDGQHVVVHYIDAMTPRPLLLALHGLGGSGASFAQLTGFSALADKQGFVVAYPDAPIAPPAPTPTPTPTPTEAPTPTPTPTPTDTTSAPNAASLPAPAPLSIRRAQAARGLVEDVTTQPGTGSNRAWDAGSCCGGSTADDVTYLRHVVAAVAGRTSIDLRRVYVVGESNGGMMALQAICQAPATFAAAGSVVGPYLGTTCARPVWLHIHDGDDPIVPFHGGTPPGSAFFDVAPNWCLCSFPDSATEPQRFATGTVKVTLYENGTHSWPQVNDHKWNVDGSGLLWSFVSRYHL